MGDDDIVDAEIVDDDTLYVHVSSELATTGSHEVDNVAQFVELTGLPAGAMDIFRDPDVLAVPMDVNMRNAVREALAFFWVKGPRHRNTVECKRAMDVIFAVEPGSGKCVRCGGTGKWQDRLGKTQVCSCPEALTA